MKKLALFDIDGVIYDGHSIFDLIQDEEKRGFIKKGLWDEILKLLDKYKSGKIDYKEAADVMLLRYSTYLVGKNYYELVKENVDFISRFKEKIFPYFSNLISELKKTHDIYFITTNFDMTAEAFTKYFRLKGFLSSKIGTTNGIINGKMDLSLGGNKGIVTDLIVKYGEVGSIAVGDSENDADMLEKVEYPLVMEPKEKLETIAREKGWEIVNRDTITGIIMTHVKE